MSANPVSNACGFLVLSVLSQIIGFGAGFIARQLGAWPILYLTAHGLVAMFMARFLKLPNAWQVLNLILPVGAMVATRIYIPSWLLAATGLLLALIYAPTFWTRVPFYPTSREMYKVIAASLPEDQDFHLVDLGCGFGSLLLYLARVRPRGKFSGVEVGLLPFAIAKIRATLLGRGRIHIHLRSFWDLPLSDYDYVYAFLAPPPMARLWEKAKNEMKPGATLLINSFPVPAKADTIKEAPDHRKTKLYSYQYHL
ncbi:MAG: class I SAM-dependent methyltransferase [Deltaproteobacteria bacterium]|nr:class I SAM-dependent methyltransferase [Deltaproteobacteria bacterium]